MWRYTSKSPCFHDENYAHEQICLQRDRDALLEVYSQMNILVARRPFREQDAEGGLFNNSERCQE